MRYTQPQSGPIQIDCGNPIARGLVLECRADQRMFDVVRSTFPSATVGNISQTIGTPGVGSTFASAVVGYGDRELFTGAQATFQIIEQPTSLSQVAGIINKRLSSISGNSFSIGYNYNAGNEFTVDIGDATGSGIVVDYQFSRASFSTTAPNNLIIVIDGQAGAGQRVKLYRNGVLVTVTGIANDTAFSSFTNTASPLEIGRVNNGTLYYSGTVFLARAWDRALSLGEALQVAANPWQLFRSPQRVMLAAAGAGTSYSYTATGGFTLSGSATKARGAVKTASGGIALSGAATQSRGAVRAAAGGIQLAGAASMAKGRAITASGGLSISGAATILRGVARSAAGGLQLAGAASVTFFSAVQTRIVNPVGGFILSGAATVVRSIRKSTAGGIQLAGHAVATFGPLPAFIGSLLPAFIRRRRR